ncbi:MAG: AbrB/MazE/SpoVT family DNA-binding domain-containing protein [Candidatus Kapabacteria bacterium]|nr:AbrB/MazE/SpoVT family DNA-binding domain-containing protein [Candidatus Kapabacteria bacterium]
MQTSITKIGNNLGIMIPKSILDKAHLNNGSIVNLDFRNGNVIIEPEINDNSIDAFNEIHFIEYGSKLINGFSPKYDEDYLNVLIQNATQKLNTIDDADVWLRELRGYSDES